MAPGQPMIKRSIRTIQSELEFLSETSVITQDQLAAILANLPDLNNLQSRGQESQPSAASPPPTTNFASPPPTQAFSSLNVSDPPKNGYYGSAPSPAPPAYPQPPQPPLAIKHATALYAYTPSDSFDLELVPGERVVVVEEMNADWWKGRSERTGREGIFPRSYVREEEKAGAAGPGPGPSSYGNAPLDVAQGQQQYGPGPGASGVPNKAGEQGKKFGKKLGNAAIFGAGATIGSNLVNSIF